MIIKLVLVDVYTWLGTHYRNTLWARKWNLATILLAVMACAKIMTLSGRYFIWGALYQKQVWRAGTSNYIPHNLCYVITCPCPSYLFLVQYSSHGPLARSVMGMPVTFSPPPWVSNLDTHQGTCVTHVPWCMPGSLTSRFLWSLVAGKTFPAFPAHAQPAILRIWQVAHGRATCNSSGDDCFVKWVHGFPSQFQ